MHINSSYRQRTGLIIQQSRKGGNIYKKINLGAISIGQG